MSIATAKLKIITAWWPSYDLYIIQSSMTSKLTTGLEPFTHLSKPQTIDVAIHSEHLTDFTSFHIISPCKSWVIQQIVVSCYLICILNCFTDPFFFLDPRLILDQTNSLISKASSPKERSLFFPPRTHTGNPSINLSLVGGLATHLKNSQMGSFPQFFGVKMNKIFESSWIFKKFTFHPQSVFSRRFWGYWRSINVKHPKPGDFQLSGSSRGKFAWEKFPWFPFVASLVRRTDWLQISFDGMDAAEEEKTAKKRCCRDV